MIISNLEYMEQIVDSRKDLSWDGWNVVQYKKDPSAQFNKNGQLYKGEWHKKSVFPIKETGWNVPDSFGKKYA